MAIGGSVKGGFQVWVDACRTARRVAQEPLNRIVLWAHLKVGKDDAPKLGSIEGACDQGDEAAKAMADDDRPRSQVCVKRHCLDRVGVGLTGVVIAPMAVAHAWQVDGSDLISVRQQRRHKVKPARMGAVAVHQQKAGAVVGF